MSAVLEERRPVSLGFLRALATTLVLLLISSLALTLLEGASAPPVTKLEVSGPFVQVKADAIRALAAPALRGNLLSLDLPLLREDLKALPWVAEARVERVWPGTVRVTVRERQAAARWGAASLVATDGAVFTPANALPDGLPVLNGPVAQSQSVLATYQALHTALTGTAFEPVRLDLDQRGEWTGLTRDGVQLRFGRGDPGEKCALLVGPAARVLAEKLMEVSYVDLRYTNGFAVGWRTREAQESVPAGGRSAQAG